MLRENYGFGISLLGAASLVSGSGSPWPTEDAKFEGALLRGLFDG